MSDTLPAGAEDTLAEMRSGVDMIRWAASTMNRAEVFFGHGYDNAIDEAVRLVLHCLDIHFLTQFTQLKLHNALLLYEMFQKLVSRK